MRFTNLAVHACPIAISILILISTLMSTSAFAVYSVDVTPTSVFYGSNFTISILSSGSGIMQIYDDYDNSIVKAYVVSGEQTIEINTENLMLPGSYYIIFRDEESNKLWDSRYNSDWQYVEVKTSSPSGVEISISTQDRISIGDRVKINIKVYPRDAQFDWLIEGPGFSKSGSDQEEVTIYETILDQGTYLVRATSNNELRQITFLAEEPWIKLTAENYTQGGDLVRINGTTNIADSEGERDVDFSNLVTLKIYKGSKLIFQASGISINDGMFRYTWRVPTSASGEYLVKAEVRVHSDVDVVTATTKIYNASEIEVTPTPSPTPTPTPSPSPSPTPTPTPTPTPPSTPSPTPTPSPSPTATASPTAQPTVTATQTPTTTSTQTPTPHTTELPPPSIPGMKVVTAMIASLIALLLSYHTSKKK